MESKNLTHLAIIMDGNGRWAKARKFPRTAGHLEGLKALRRCILGCIDINVKFLTLYAFSTENWKRPEAEVNYLMTLFASKLPGELSFYNKNEIRILTRGDNSRLPVKAQKAIQRVEAETKNNKKITVVLCVNYGGQAEIAQAVNKIIKENPTETITPDMIREHMQYPELPQVDMIVRSAGEKRLSNFLLWESAYSEFGFYDRLFPEWDEAFIKKIYEDFQKRTRKFGGLAK